MKDVRVLIVEDDQFKLEDIVRSFFSDSAPDIAKSVRDAVRSVSSTTYQLVVLDMALPTFEARGKSGSGSAQAQGGIDVLRTLGRAKLNSKVIILSQYPNLEFQGETVRLVEARTVLNDKYNVNIIGAVVYDLEDPAWKTEFGAILKHEDLDR